VVAAEWEFLWQQETAAAATGVSSLDVATSATPQGVQRSKTVLLVSRLLLLTTVYSVICKKLFVSEMSRYVSSELDVKL